MSWPIVDGVAIGFGGAYGFGIECRHMTVRAVLSLVSSHLIAVGLGFLGGIYYLPILIAPATPEVVEVAAAAKTGLFFAEFSPDRKGSDIFHWGEGRVSIGPDSVVFAGKLSPGPDYKLYLSPEFVETTADFKRLRPSMAQIGEVKTFNNFIVPLSQNIDPANYNTIIVWCEAFGQYITSAAYVARPL